MQEYFDLGSHSFPVTTASAEAQLWFDRGLNWTFGYNHEEAVACYRRALEHDPACAMAHWGVAYATGPNYNYPWVLMDPVSKARVLSEAFAATGQALAHIDGVTPEEAALIRALPARYPQAKPPEDTRPWDTAFAEAMRGAQRAHPDSLDIRTICAEAMLNRTPWKMWDLKTGAPGKHADTLECQALLEAALDHDPRAMRHPGILHLYIHLMEMSPTPEKALRAADALRPLVPDAGHLVHMPTHIDVQCGAYQDTVFWNQRAVVADEKFYHREGGMNFYTGYRQHDYHFVIYGALFLGQMEPALAAVRQLAATTPPEMLRIETPPYAMFFEAYLAMEPHVYIRFGQWQRLIDMDLPEDPKLYATLNATTLYAKALAHAALGQVESALEMEQRFLTAVEQMPDRWLHVVDVKDLMAVATEMLRGEILYRQGRFDEAFAALRRSVALDDGLPYDEPWGWMQPTRHALGALLFEQGHVAEAEEVYREDLGLAGDLPRACIHPDNVWSLKGLHDCLEARGDSAELPLIRQKLDLALARADTAVAASCFCAQAAMTGTPGGCCA
ncbi:TPR domain protein [Oceanicola sp. 22II-s10i]|uniref:tetratricopeptide repeat protein n=1 Tax=Oceanicola sp. 22II-s10i TaxID=1317116 RepID=UPI000B521CA9|nr:tetratricopeptide repeat protein [Oceanicola sp. 22II-s10i]OWU83544.1 TPR domain protein [Oceanicola sp. 22II-s10i]